MTADLFSGASVKVPRKCVRLSCYECFLQYDGITPAKLARLIGQGWKQVVEERSWQEATDTTDPDKDLDWETHRGYCPDCSP